MDWTSWHDKYDAPDSDFARRLAMVRELTAEALDHAGPGPGELRALSLCAGQGRDLIPVLAAHPRGHEVRARLVELDPENASVARKAAAEAGLEKVEVITGDASLTDHYLDFAPADLLLVCGLYGNITLPDIETTVAACTALCAPGGTVIWTRGRPAPDQLPQICAWYEERGFERLWVSEPEFTLGVAAHRFTGTPGQLEPGRHLFEFIGYDVLNASNEPSSSDPSD